MTAAKIIERLAASGICLSATEGTLKVDAPAGVLTVEIKAELVRRKPELLVLLVPKPCTRCNTPMQRIEFGYFACSCGYQVTEPRSGFWVQALPDSERVLISAP